jgi:cell division protein FtsZ
MEGRMRVSVVATGIDAKVKRAEDATPRRSMSAPLPQAHQAPAAVAAAPAPVAAQADARLEPSLFEDLETDLAPVMAPRHEAPTSQARADDLPPPAYTPRPEPTLSDADTFVAPRAPAPGTPSPEALARLQAAVNRVPKPADQQQRPAPRAAEAEKPRFGINSLINRMTGAQADASAAQQPARTQPQVTALRPEQAAEDDQDRIEIPAFLRRQAN